MGTFIVISQGPDQEANERIRERIDKEYSRNASYEIDDRIHLIAGPDFTQDILDALRPEGDPETHFVVLSLNGSFGGRSRTDLWNWLRDADRAFR